jgi:GNAT superfamily N-acetyltransferase
MIETRPSFGVNVVALPGCMVKRGVAAGEVGDLVEMFVELDPWRRLNMDAAVLRSYFSRNDPALHRYVVNRDHRLAGLLCVRYPWLRGPYIEFFGLGSEHHGIGLGTQIMAWAEREARLESKNLWVIVSSFNHGGRRFYERCGFSPIGEISGLVAAGSDELLMRKHWF